MKTLYKMAVILLVFMAVGCAPMYGYGYGGVQGGYGGYGGYGQGGYGYQQGYGQNYGYRGGYGSGPAFKDPYTHIGNYAFHPLGPAAGANDRDLDTQYGDCYRKRGFRGVGC